MVVVSIIFLTVVVCWEAEGIDSVFVWDSICVPIKSFGALSIVFVTVVTVCPGFPDPSTFPVVIVVVFVVVVCL